MDDFILKFIKYQLYLLQLENYELGRYWKLLVNKGFFPNNKQPQRKELVWTAKARALMLMAGALHILAVIVAGYVVLNWRPGLDSMFTVMVLVLLVLLPFYFVLFSLALLVLWPLDAYVKSMLVKKAQEKIRKLSSPSSGLRPPSPSRGEGGLIVIGVAGSYGKTTTKEILSQVLGVRYKVLATPESVNTPVGIARFILNKVDESTQVIIMEMGEHYRGDIKELCEIARPDIAVLTGSNEAHLERMGSLENVIATIFEAAEFAKPGASIVLNGDDANITNYYRKFTTGHQVIFYSSGKGLTNFNITNKKFDEEGYLWQFSVEGKGVFTIKLLGEYAVGAGVAALAVGEMLGLSAMDLKIGLSQIGPIEHRLQPIKSAGDVLVIDDSYNANPQGVEEAVKVLSKFSGHRKIFITPGMVEIGNKSAELHRAVGRQLAGVADVVILIKNSVTGFIEEGLKSAKQQTNKSVSEIIWFDTAQEMHQALKNIIKPGDVVLFQNDWGDQYL